MRLYNQTKHYLSWTIGTTRYTCEAFGEVEVPDIFVSHCKARQLPLDVTPVPKEVRAEQTLAAATDEARSDELRRIQHQASVAGAAAEAAKAEVEQARVALELAQQKALGLELSVEEQKRQNEALAGEKKAVEKLLEETGRKLVAAEEELQRQQALAKAGEDIAKSEIEKQTLAYGKAAKEALEFKTSAEEKARQLGEALEQKAALEKSLTSAASELEKAKKQIESLEATVAEFRKQTKPNK